MYIGEKVSVVLLNILKFMNNSSMAASCGFELAGRQGPRSLWVVSEFSDSRFRRLFARTCNPQLCDVRYQ